MLSISSATDEDYCSALSTISPDYMSLRSINSWEFPVLELTVPASVQLGGAPIVQTELTAAAPSSPRDRRVRLTVNCLPKFEKARSVESSDGPTTTPSPSPHQLGPMYLPDPNRLLGPTAQNLVAGVGSSMLSRAATIRKHLSFRIMRFARDGSSEMQQSVESQGSSSDRDDEISQLRARWVSNRAATCPFVIGTKDFDNYQEFLKSDKKRRHFDFDSIP